MIGLPDEPRMEDIVDLAWAVRRNGAQNTVESDLQKGYWCFPHLSVDAKPWGSTLPPLTSQTIFFSFELDMALSGVAHMRLAGFPKSVPGTWSDASARAFAAGACFLFLLHSVTLVISRKPTHD